MRRRTRTACRVVRRTEKRRSEDYGYMADIHQSIGYRQAIDDFVKAIVDRGLSSNDDKYCIILYDNYLKVIKEIAEQLKEGVNINE